MKIKHIFPIALITLSSCLKIKKKDEVEPSAQTEVQNVLVLSENRLSIRYIPTEEPNNYTAHISWPQTSATLRFISSDGQVFQSENNEIQIPKQSYQKPTSVTVDQLENGSQKLITHFNLSLQAPQDWVVGSPTYFQKNEEINVERIFFLTGAQVYTQQFNVKIRAKKLISASGAILGNFPENAEAAVETVGLSGGMIDLKIEQAAGSLSILINGQRGGHGKHGFAACTSISSPCNPNSGADSGDTGELSLDIYDQSNFKLEYKRAFPVGGKTGEFKNIQSGASSRLCSENWEDISDRKDANLVTCEAPYSRGKPGKVKQICIKNYQTNKFDCE